MAHDDPVSDPDAPRDLGALLAERARRDRVRRHDERERLLGELDDARRHIEDLERRIDEIHRSETWKLGRAAKRALTPAVAARDAIVRRRRPARPPTVPTWRPTSDVEARHRYQAAIDRGTSPDEALAPTVTFAVYTTDLAEGRGDIYVAVGLGLELESLGWRCRYVPRDRWDVIAPDTDVVVAMIQTFDPLAAPAAACTIAWVRNETDTWRRHPSLQAFDAVLCSSEQSRVAMAQRYRGPTEVLALGVDTTLFGPSDDARQGIATTVNDWGRERQVYRALRAATIDFDLTIAGHVDLGGSLADHHIGLVDYFALADLYRRSQAVVDDFNHTTAPYGNVNSRLLEALACDTAVITNSSVGLESLGLAATPVYRDDRELADMCRRAADGDYRSLATELGAHVRSQHSWTRRAATFDAIVTSLRTEHLEARRVIGFHPDFRITNPYQDLLYRAFDRTTVLAPVPDPFDISALDLAAERGVPYVHHVHWTSTILGPATTATEAHRRRVAFVAELDRIRRHGATVVWTVHNELPHECAHPDVELQMRRQIAARCDAVHVMCERSRAIVIERFGAAPEATFVVPMPAYTELYTDTDLDVSDARSHIGLSHASFVYLFLGTIRPYKGIDALLDAFGPVHDDDDGVALVVAGRPDHPSVPALEARCRATPGVHDHFEEVPDDELTIWFRAADAVVLPYRYGLNSSAVLLAYSLGLPVVAPAIGCITELLDPHCAVAFDPAAAGSLEAALRRVRDLDPGAARRRALAIAAAADPASISVAFLHELDARARHTLEVGRRHAAGR